MKWKLAVLIWLAAATVAASEVFEWGWPGYDPGITGSRYGAWIDPADEQRLIISVDAEETVNGTAAMELRAGAANVKSTECYKVMRHLNAPWACRFALTEVAALAGEGEVVTYDGKGRRLLSGPVDFDRLRAAVTGQDPLPQLE